MTANQSFPEDSGQTPRRHSARRPGTKARKWRAAVLVRLQPRGDLGEGSAVDRWETALSATAVAMCDAVQRRLFLPMAREFAANMACALVGNAQLHVEAYPSVSVHPACGLR